MRKSFTPITFTLLLAATCTAFGAGGGEMPSTPARLEQPKTPEEQARDDYNAGVRLVEKADALQADAARQADEKKKTKVLGKAQQAYKTAMKKMGMVTDLQPSNYQAWNYLGYTNRKLGHYDAALAAYDRALSLKPDYAEAIEYRGHAYLGLNRLNEAKEAYLSLFAANRKLAATLLAAMQNWVGERRNEAAGIDGPTLESFASWVSERSTIASQTAALTREGAASAWH
ncbi:MAG TPA: tetratricopeptide repeat protein [Steroidobacteraceae bacterium]|nr:tetratricopeptide repeat protein [Steroidobacteraceae bacterium]